MKAQKEIDLEELEERLALSIDRITQIQKEETVSEIVRDYFVKTASFILDMKQLFDDVQNNFLDELTMEECRMKNQKLYLDIMPESYEKSYANPRYAQTALTEDYGKILCFLYTEIRGMIVYAYEKRMEEMVILCELFIEIYNCFEAEELPTYQSLRDIIYWFESDYSDLTVAYRIREQLDPDLSFATDIIMQSDLSDLRYLYKFGEYISENEIKIAEFMNNLPEQQVREMADTYTEGYRIGFVNGNKDLSKKEVVNIRYCIGFERMIRYAIQNFEKMGLRPTIYRAAVMSIHKRSHHKIGYFSMSPNKQYDYDHKADQGLYLDKKFVERKLGVMRNTYETYKELAYKHAGPAVVEIFGEIPFVPESKPEAVDFDDTQQKLLVYFDSESGQLVNQYIKGEERSFTIIAFPVPTIGDKFEEIFKETVKINTLDYTLYQNIQQTIIDALDGALYVEILGEGENRTNLKVSLHQLKNPETETVFENCVADVNIPVGEVFTSPVLKGTTGTLHVSRVYLNELEYNDLEIEFKDGMVASYICKNFAKEEENQKYIRENVLYHHDTLPMGEFAIGTNTTAYIMAQKYNIAEKLPILIAEKMGPHFAIGDTCYSHSEEVKVLNPNGKEVVAKDNEISIQRKENPSKAYFHCHTDITIPYDELQQLSAVMADGTKHLIIQNGRFVLLGTEELNKPFE
ncbi:aminopeptidase [Anaerosacchariphilus polymeriproducens]|uniref:Leucyl aminopeptidase n=1 Tax=Anaerosacchariphilus polymeriproducens TaxID=1812858 RepID=A0A371AUY5_9FIRM|nr:aminopeptidase [Anaerosacchariphilus polymeriproducens]RDU23388.1 leucyl aminopeptidase [Anaerosacchariphilus polymeriproducens]